MDLKGKKRVRDFSAKEKSQYEKVRKQKRRTCSSNKGMKPIGLCNPSFVNVCFGNAGIQMLYSIEEFRRFVHDVPEYNISVTKFKELFSKMSRAKGVVTSMNYYHSMAIPHYSVDEQFDAHEFMAFLLDAVYPDIKNSSCIFKIVVCSCLATCLSCGNILDANYETTSILNLTVASHPMLQSVHELLQLHLSGESVQYTCIPCSHIDKVQKTITFDNCPQVLVIQLISSLVRDTRSNHHYAVMRRFIAVVCLWTSVVYCTIMAIVLNLVITLAMLRLLGCGIV